MNEKYEAVVLKEESEYELSDELAESFEGMDIDTGPKIDQSASRIAGIVESCEYEEGTGIVAMVAILDKRIQEGIDENIYFICPTIARELGETNSITGIDLFITSYPGDGIGSVEKV